MLFDKHMQINDGGVRHIKSHLGRRVGEGQLGLKLNLDQLMQRKTPYIA